MAGRNVRSPCCRKLFWCYSIEVDPAREIPSGDFPLGAAQQESLDSIRLTCNVANVHVFVYSAFESVRGKFGAVL